MLAASLAFLVGCGKDKITAVTGLNGQMVFTYSGGLSGTFNVTGQMPTSQSAMETSSWAAGEVVTADNATYVAASTPRTASTHDLVFVQINRTNAGNATIDFDNCVATNCTTVFFLFGFANGSGTTFLQDCYLQTGTVTITSISATRAQGTFSGAGVCNTPGDTQTAFTVTGGTFDVALVPGVS